MTSPEDARETYIGAGPRYPTAATCKTDDLRVSFLRINDEENAVFRFHLPAVEKTIGQMVRAFIPDVQDASPKDVDIPIKHLRWNRTGANLRCRDRRSRVWPFPGIVEAGAQRHYDAMDPFASFEL